MTGVSNTSVGSVAIRNHVCPKCGNGYTVIKSLRRHLRYECGLTPRFKCPYCGTRSKQRGHNIKLEASLECQYPLVIMESKGSDDDEKPFSSRSRRNGLKCTERHMCSRCSKSYIHAWHLKRHTKFECGQEPKVQCPYCTVRMKQRGHVYRHIRQCHRGKNVYVIDLN
ncbi:Longitudinals lacking protein, isoforms A/B/D/L [Harpegnathos saltator]|uniref:Longitudinals lacking protein, isoforms A/B/D/L n=1 Tax=Harpegnathos saltator TaxID=610380 RepID=E2BJB1_HARSA|nr:Longitudinals lacking protein, isoforms A/B/D/L [Harpegnathos saltator]